jgi:hypothetical protein
MKPKFTREQLQAMLEDLDKDDSVDEVIVEDGGKRYHVRGARATSILDKLFGGDGADSDGSGDVTDSDGTADDGDSDDSNPKGTSSVWGRQK